MAVKIRMKKMGSKKRPFYRVVAVDTRSPRDGRFIETLGYYNPLNDPPDVRFDEDKVFKWLNVGAEPSSNIKQLLKKAGLLEKWQLLRSGVKISELDAAIEKRRDKQPKPKPAAEKRKSSKKKAAEVEPPADDRETEPEPDAGKVEEETLQEESGQGAEEDKTEQ